MTSSRFSEKDRPRMRIPLAKCLSLARASAETGFPRLVADLDFDPASIALLERRDFYAGRTNRWSRSPGPFERHLQRREANPMFREEIRDPSDDEIKAAREKDEIDFRAAEKAVIEWLKGVEDMVGLEGGRKPTIGDFAAYHKSSAEVLVTCAQAGGKAEHLRDKVRIVDETLAAEIIKAMEKSSPGDAAALRESDAKWIALRDVESHAFFAQCAWKDGPIANDEDVAALLCEGVQTVQDITQIWKHVFPERLKAIYQEGEVLAERAKEAKFEIPAIEEKLAILRSVVRPR